ncbi:hypothetical protein SB758_37590, partial [Burkholderia sp. SIMBA_013]
MLEHGGRLRKAAIQYGITEADWLDLSSGLAPWPCALQKPLPFLAVGRVLLRDRRVVCFTLGGVLSAVVFGQFTAWLSQYLVTTTTA